MLSMLGQAWRWLERALAASRQRDLVRRAAGRIGIY